MTDVPSYSSRNTSHTSDDTRTLPPAELKRREQVNEEMSASGEVARVREAGCH